MASEHISFHNERSIIGIQGNAKDSAVNIHVTRDEIDKLPVAEGAGFDSYEEDRNARCLPGTRCDLLRQITEWARDHDTKAIFWLNGMAGTGKSTVSRTVAESFSNSGELCGTFFFKRGEGDRGKASKLFTTIAAQLALRRPACAPLVRNAIGADPAICGKGLREQFEKLILEPLSKVTYNSRKPVGLIVVDALDECERDDDVRLIVNLFSRAKTLNSLSLKVFVTSRPDLPIRLSFRAIDGKYQDLVLHEIPKPIVAHDISAFFEYKLARIRDDYNSSVNEHRQLPEDWPGQLRIETLVEMAVPLFIFAATVCRFLSDRRFGDPDIQLRKVMDYQTSSLASKLDATYLPALHQLLIGLSAREQAEQLSRFRYIVGSIVVLAAPLSTASLARILGISIGDIDCLLDLLHSVLSVPSSPDSPVRLLHLSFRNFLLDPEKRASSRFWVDEKQAHSQLATQCLRLMRENLRRDICRLGAPGILRSDIDSQLVDKYLLPELRYACVYWVYHIEWSNSLIYDDGHVHQFLMSHFLHWLEAMSLLRAMDEAVLSVTRLESLLKKQSAQNELLGLVQDACRFILYNRWVIENAPFQTYSSALLFSPTQSLIRVIFNEELAWIRTKPLVESKWSPCLQTLEGHSGPVYSVAFSPDSKLVASGSDDNTVKIWNAATGNEVHALRGHSSPVNSIAFSPDSKLVASGSRDRTVKIWDAATGNEVGAFRGHSYSVNSVAFSPNLKLVVSGSDDKTIKIWDVTTGNKVRTLRGHSNSVDLVAFSHDSKLIVSGSHDTVKIWDVATGNEVYIFSSYPSVFTSVAFSPNSELVALGSYDSIKIWDRATGNEVHTLRGHSSWVNSVAYSPNSKLVVSGSDDNTIKIWDAATGNEVDTLRGHSYSVNSVAFSPDSKLIVSGSDDSIKIWDAAKGNKVYTLRGHSSPVITIAFSPDSKLIVSGSDDTIKIWETATGNEVCVLRGHSSLVNSIAFSPDSKLMVSALHDSVKVWDVATGNEVHTLKGHSGPVTSVVFSPDLKLIASGSYNVVKIWDAATGNEVCALRDHSDPVTSVAFSPDLRLIASGSYDAVKIRDVATGNEVCALRDHSGPVTSIAFSHDLKLVASGSRDRTVKIWDAATGTEVHAFKVSTALYNISFNTTSSFLLTDVGTIYLDGVSSTSTDVEATSQALAREIPCQGYGLDPDQTWITWNGSKVLWLPPDYRASSSAISSLQVAIGCRSGRVIILGFSGPPTL